MNVGASIFTAITGEVIKYVGRKRIAVVIGDSISNGTSSFAPTSLSASGTTVTVAATAHGLLPGMKIQVGRASPDEYNGYHEVATIPSANSFTYVVPHAPATSPATGSDITIYPQHKWTARNYLAMASARLGGIFDDVICRPIGGQTTEQIRARLASVFEYQPAVVMVIGGINDVMTDVATADIIANLEVMYERVRAANAICVGMTIGPLGTGHADYSTARLQVIHDVNRWIRRYAAEHTEFILVDAFQLWVDPTDADGEWRSGYTSDDVHPDPLASWYLSAPLATALSKYFTALPWPDASATNNYGADTASAQLMDNGLFSGTGGNLTGSPTPTGDAADGWNVTVQGSVSGIVGTAETARADGIGFDLKAAVTASAANGGVTIPLSSPNHARINAKAGKVLQFGVHLKLDTIGQNTANIQVAIELTYGGVAYKINAINGLVVPAGATDVDLYLVTSRMVIPSLTFTAARPRITATLSAAGAFNVLVGRAFELCEDS